MAQRVGCPKGFVLFHILTGVLMFMAWFIDEYAVTDGCDVINVKFYGNEENRCDVRQTLDSACFSRYNEFKLTARPSQASRAKQVEMSKSGDIPQSQAFNNAVISGHTPTSVSGHGTHKFLVPSPIPTRRSRTYSASERAFCGETKKGQVQSFCRQKGHGFVIPDDDSNHHPLFVHISDIDGEYVPQVGDEVTFKKFLIPPRNEKYQAVHVQIINLAPGVTHERWDAPVSPVGSPSHKS